MKYKASQLVVKVTTPMPELFSSGAGISDNPCTHFMRKMLKGHNNSSLSSPCKRGSRRYLF
ncbi:MAG: hypothetical protein SFT68_02510 [Rickettsiaceae bacterium]|nr:hypothetical protein [Rickettsiaceae bacterium]